MSSFWMPKKQPLYAPMLGTFGGGSARGFGHSLSSSGGSGTGYFGAEYQGWTGSDLIFNTSAGYDEYQGSSTNTWEALDTFIDNANNIIYGGYDTVHSYPWTNGGNLYAGNAQFYSVTYSNRVNLSGHTLSGITSNGRGCTVAYLNDANRTAVLVIGNTSSNEGAYFFQLSNGAYLGKADFTDGSSTTASNGYEAGLVWDGTYLLRMDRTNSNVWAHELPTTTNISGYLPNVYKWNSPSKVHYGMVFAGFNALGQRRIIYADQNNQTAATEILLDVPTTPTNYNLGTSTVGSAGRYDLGTTNYSLAIDYKNSKLIVGGYNNHKYRVWGT